MTRLSTRYVPQLALLLAPVLVPVVVHSYGGFQVEDCANPARLFPAANTLDGQRDRWMGDNFGPVQWREGSFEDDGATFRFAILRSWDPKKLYHHPEAALAYGSAPDRRAVEWIAEGSERLPIHRAYFEKADSLFVGYLLVYDSGPVSNPYVAQLRAFPRQLIAGRRPMTLFFISARSTHPGAGAETRARQWLLARWKDYAAACRF